MINIFVILFSLMFVVMYLFPTLMAYAFKVKDKEYIFVTNLLIGWTCIGWFLCLFWFDSENQNKFNKI